MLLQTVVLTVANTEYTLTLPAGTHSYVFKCRDAAVTYRHALATGKVAGPAEAYMGFAAGQSFTSPPALKLGSGSLVLYFASVTAGAVIEVVAYK